MTPVHGLGWNNIDAIPVYSCIVYRISLKDATVAYRASERGNVPDTADRE